MSAKEPANAKPGRTLDSAYTFSFAIAIGLILFIAGLVISLTLGGGSSIGLIFGIPLLLAGLVVPLIMMRQFFTQNEVSGPCPYCSAPIKTSDATIRLECPNCHGVVGVRDEKLYAVETSN
jgi:fatty acid desaturase